MIPSIQQARPYEQVTEVLAEMIVTGKVRPGESLDPEPVLCSKLGASRTVVREAMKLLSAKGLVTIRQGKGTVVNPTQRWSHLDPMILHIRLNDPETAKQVLIELVEVRRMIEVEAAELAALRRTPEDAEAMTQLVNAMTGAVGDAEAYTQLDNEFHLALFQASGNQILISMISSLKPLLTAGKRLANLVREEAARESNAGHRRILEAVLAQDPSAAGQAMRSHLTQFEGDIKLSLAQVIADEYKSYALTGFTHTQSSTKREK